MSATFEDSVLDFDINLFQQSSNNALVQSTKDKIRKALYLSKDKMMSTDSLIRKYYDKRLSCHTLERCLLTSKDEYKQACIESMEYQEKCSVLQDEIKKLQLANRELEEKYVAADNRHDGMQSHAKQLELLVKQNETTIESMKIDYNMEKENSRTLEKKCVNLQEENKNLTKNICLLRDIVFGKKKLTKELKLMLKKYGKSGTDTDESEGVSCDEPDTCDSPMSPLSDSGVCSQMLTSLTSENNKKNGGKDNATEEYNNTRDDNDHDSECSNEVVSLDTGRGSSLEFSDSDKCFNSPDYFDHHSPMNSDALKNKVTVDVATSPLPTKEFANIATSPVKFRSEKTFADQNGKECCETALRDSLRKPVIPKILVDREVSPITVPHLVDVSTSPMENLTSDIATSPVKLSSSSSCSIFAIDHIEKEKECLEINHSGILEDENSSDSEIQMILHTMRFNKKLITPIPTTPAKPRGIEMPANNATPTVLHSNGCPDAAKLREDNITLQATVAKLAQDVLNINNFLNQFNPSKHDNTLLCHKGISQSVNSKYNVEPAILYHQLLNEVPSTHHHKPLGDKVIENGVSCKDKMSKLKEKNSLLFDDCSLPNASDPPPPAPAAASPAPLDSDVQTLDEYESNINLNSKERLHFEDPLLNQGSVSEYACSDSDIYEDEIVIELPPDSLESDRNELHILAQKHVNDDKTTKKTPKSKKLTKLDRLRNRMLPKSKIKNVEVQTKRKRRIQQLRFKAHKNRLTKANTLINNKAAYERACKVMSEIKSKEKAGNTSVIAPPRKQVKPRQQICRKTLKSSEPLSTILNSTESHVQLTDEIASDDKPSVGNNNVQSSQNGLPQITETMSGPVGSAETGINNDDIDKANKMVCQPHTATSTYYKNGDLSDQRTIRTRSQSKSIYHNNENSVTQKPSDQNTNTGLSNQSPSVLRNQGKNKEENITLRSNSVTRSNVGVTAPAKENKQVQPETRKRLRRQSDDKPDVAPKRILRSSSVLSEVSAENGNNSSVIDDNAVTYDDLDMFDNTVADEQNNKKIDKEIPQSTYSENTMNPKFSILCRFLDKYATKSQKRTEPKISEKETNNVCKKLEEIIAEIQKLPPKDVKLAMDELVQVLQGWTTKHLLSGLIKYLKEPNRKIESFNKTCVPPAPPMTKAEQILIYIVTQLKVTRPNIVNSLLEMIEYTLFMLNRTPEFDVIDTLSHFYAVLCRYEKDRNRLRLFIIDAMYCMQYKSVPLIRQCMEVWMHVLPLAHMGIAKSPLVMCLVYLLHFYKCDDKFNRVQEIRNILNRKYFYEVAEWNETRILEMFRNAIIELRDIPVEKKMLRIAIIILAKRHGARWCQKNIIKNMLQPIIEDTRSPERTRAYCVSLLGPLLKPYPVEMKINCEIAMNQLSDMLNRNPSKQMQEAIFTSLVFMSKHNHNQVIKTLLFWSPESVSPELEELLINYVRERNMKSWKTVLSRISFHKNEQ